MPKYYVESGRVRLVFTARHARQAAAKALKWSRDRQAQIYSQPPGDLIRDAEAMDYMLGGEITVNETGFGGRGEVFNSLDIVADGLLNSLLRE
jgi:hypothetical protein